MLFILLEKYKFSLDSFPFPETKVENVNAFP